MARYKDLYTPARDYGQVYRQGMAQRVSSQEKAGDQMRSFAGDIYDLVDRQHQREAAMAEAAAIERQHKAQRRLWEHQTRAENKRLGLEDKRLGLEGRRISLQDRQLDIQAAQHLHRKSHDEKTLKQRGVEASDLKEARRLERELKKEDSEFVQYESRLEQLGKRYKDFKIQEGRKKWKLESFDLTVESWQNDSKAIKELITDARGQADPNQRLAQLKSILIANDHMFAKKPDPVALEQVTPDNVHLLDNYLKLKSRDQYMKEQIKDTYDPAEFKEQGTRLRWYLFTALTHPKFGVMDKDDEQMIYDIMSTYENRLPSSGGKVGTVKSQDDVSKESYLNFDKSGSSKDTTESGASEGSTEIDWPKLILGETTIGQELNKSPEVAEKVKLVEASRFAVKDIVTDFSTNLKGGWLGKTKDLNKHLAVAEMANAIKYASEKTDRKQLTLEETRKKFETMGGLIFNLEQAANTEGGSESQDMYYQQAHRQWIGVVGGANMTYDALVDMSSRGDDIAQNFLENIDYLMTEKWVGKPGSTVVEDRVSTNPNSGDFKAMAKDLDSYRDYIMGILWSGTKAAGTAIRDGMVWYRKFHNEFYQDK